MAKHKKTVDMVTAAKLILAECNPMTVRQVYYQLVSKHIIKNNKSAYHAVINALVDARKEGVIPWEHIEDRNRQPREVSMWAGLPDFAETCLRSYRRDVWQQQENYVEVWLEKDALSGIFEDVLNLYGVTLNVGRGYDGWSSIHNAAVRYSDIEKPTTILYFGDFDPSGVDMSDSLLKRLNEQAERLNYPIPAIVRCALNGDDIQRYNLPPDFAKTTDTRTKKFKEKHGDIAVELDAMPINVLRSRLKNAVEANMDMDALKETKADETRDQEYLVKVLSAAQVASG